MALRRLLPRNSHIAIALLGLLARDKEELLTHEIYTEIHRQASQAG